MGVTLLSVQMRVMVLLTGYSPTPKAVAAATRSKGGVLHSVAAGASARPTGQRRQSAARRARLILW